VRDPGRGVTRTVPLMRLTLVRNATLVVEHDGRKVLVDPALDEAGTRPPVGNTEPALRNPLVPLPLPTEEIVRDLDAVLVTHLHRDHLDEAGERLVPRDVPVFCQAADEAPLRELGFDARPVDGELDWEGLRLARAGGRHSLDPSVEPGLGPVSGFVLGDLYVVSDSVWCDEVAAALVRWRPRIAVVNSGAARFIGSGPISMTAADVREVAARAPVTVAVHLEAINHCPLTRAELRAAVPEALVPEDGETLEL
jgi:L-ascorbate metabolism protein UlaG (beta-lactamase superfamily)